MSSPERSERMKLRSPVSVLVLAIFAGGIAAVALDGLWAPTFHVTMETFKPSHVEVCWKTAAEPGREQRDRAFFRLVGRGEASVSVPTGASVVTLEPRMGRGPVSLLELRVTRGTTLFRWSPENEFAGWKAGHPDQRVAVDENRLLITHHGARPQLVNTRLEEQLGGPLRLQRILAGTLVGVLVAAFAGLVLLLRSRLGQPPLGERGDRSSLRAPKEGAARGQRRWLPRLAVALGSLLVFGSAAWYLVDRSYPDETSGYRDPENTSGVSFLNYRGERISKNHGPVGLILDPFTFFRNYPSQESDHFHIDENGYRGGIRAPSLPKLAILGGSAAFGFGMSSDDQTVSARLEKLLEGRCCINAAVIGYVSGQELSEMIHHLDRQRPEVYVAVDGWNDYYEHRGDRQILGVNGRFFGVGGELQRLCEGEWGADLDPWPFAPPTFPVSEEDRLRECLDLYVTNLERMNAWAHGRGARFIAAFQPVVACRRTPTEEEKAIHVSETVREYVGFVDEARERCSALGIECLDLNREEEFQGATETLFLDPVHLSAGGHEALARVLRRMLD